MNALAIHLYLIIRYINLSFNYFCNFYRIIVINEISLDGKKLDMLEERVNEIYGNVMKEIRKDLPDMKEIDYNLYLFMILGISNPSISILLKEKKINAVYDRKRRLKDKIKALSPVLQSKYMAPFS